MEYIGTYYQCNKCKHIIDYSDSHCPECGNQDETEINAKEVNRVANLCLIPRDFKLNEIGKNLLKMLESHDDLLKDK